MLLNKFLPKTDFKSYDDFLENFELNIPDNFNFAFDVVDYIADREPERKALIWTDGDIDKVITFKELKEYSNKVANFFKNIGVKKGDKVMLILKRKYQFWYVIMALHKIGAIAIPATHLLTEKDIVYRIEAAGIETILSINESPIIDSIENSIKKIGIVKNKIVLKDHREGFITFDKEVDKCSPLFNRGVGSDNCGGKDPMILYFTSGTTGLPKMALHNYNYPLGHIITARYWHNIEDGDIHLTVSDTGWAKSLWGKLYGQWICGGIVFVYDYENFVPSKMLKMITKYQVSTFCAPPTIYRYLIKEDFSKYDLSKLKYVTTAGEALNPEIFDQFKVKTGLKLYEAFGQTELTLLLGTFYFMEPRPGAMGRPSPQYDVDIIDENGASCEIGKTGEIVVRTDKKTPPGIFLGYYRDQELTDSVWNNNIYHTGDLAWCDEDGFYWFVGRIDDIIKSSGYRIGPFEIESVLLEHPSVLECAVTGIPDDLRGQVVKATVVLSNGYSPSEDLIKELQDFVKNMTAPYKYPRIIEFVKELPKTISGKIRRVEIREHDDKS